MKLLTERAARAAANRSGGITSIDYTMIKRKKNSLFYDSKGLVLSSDYFTIFFSKPFSLSEISPLFSFLQNIRSCILKHISNMISERILNLKFDIILLQLIDLEENMEI